MAKRFAISVRVPDELKEAAERAATADHRSVASLVEKLLTKYLRKEGYLPKEDSPKAGVPATAVGNKSRR